MSDESLPAISHPAGDQPCVAEGTDQSPVTIDTYAGPVKVDWDPEASVTTLGHLAFFIEYLKIGGRFDALVADCPLTYTSHNKPEVRDILGTVVLGILAGYWRYAHFTALRGETVSAELLGMQRIRSEDSVRRGLSKIDGEQGAKWLCRHLKG